MNFNKIEDYFIRDYLVPTLFDIFNEVTVAEAHKEPGEYVPHIGAYQVRDTKRMQYDIAVDALYIKYRMDAKFSWEPEVARVHHAMRELIKSMLGEDWKNWKKICQVTRKNFALRKDWELEHFGREQFKANRYILPFDRIVEPILEEEFGHD